jgi:hypothetical protein
METRYAIWVNARQDYRKTMGVVQTHATREDATRVLHALGYANSRDTSLPLSAYVTFAASQAFDTPPPQAR